MGNTVATRFILSGLLSAAALLGIMALVWTAMADLQSNLTRYATKTTYLSSMFDTQTAFSAAERTASIELQRPNIGRRERAVAAFDDVVVRLEREIGDQTDFVAEVRMLQDEVTAYRDRYLVASQLEQDTAERGVEISNILMRAQSLIALMEYSEQIQPEGARRALLMDIKASFYGARDITHQADYKTNMPLLGIMDAQIVDTIELLDRFRQVVQGELNQHAEALNLELTNIPAQISLLRALEDLRAESATEITNRAGPAVYAQFGTVTTLISQNLRTTAALTQQRSATIRDRVMMIASVATVLLLAFLIWNITSLLRALRQFTAAVRNLAAGKSAGQIPSWRKDEFGEMARAVTEIDASGAAARRIRDALDSSDMMLIVAHTPQDVVYVSQPMQDFQNTHGAAQGELGPLAWLIEQDAQFAACVEENQETTISIELDARHYDVLIQPIAQEGEQDGFVVQMIDRTAARTLQHDIGYLMAQMIAGDFTARISVSAGEDALSAIAQDVNRMSESFEHGFASVTATIASLARGDLTHRMDGRYDGIFDVLQTNINSSLATLGELVGDITLTGETLANYSGDVAREADELSVQTETQAAALRESSATMQEMAHAISHTSDRGRELRNISTATLTDAQDAAEIAMKARNAMAEIQTAAARMRDIVAVINAISFQTKLLALNAAVEAARAGQAGSGFAVVASEVRHLADRTARSARDISDLISTSINHVESGSVQVRQTGDRLDAIARAVADMDRAIISISTMATEQSRSIEEVTEAIAAMDDATQKQASLAEGGAHRARSLQESAKRLKTLIAQFSWQTPSHISPPSDLTVPPVRRRSG